MDFKRNRFVPSNSALHSPVTSISIEYHFPSPPVIIHTRSISFDFELLKLSLLLVRTNQFIIQVSRYFTPLPFARLSLSLPPFHLFYLSLPPPIIFSPNSSSLTINSKQFHVLIIHTSVVEGGTYNSLFLFLTHAPPLCF